MSFPSSLRTETLVLGGGCFWCLDAAYRLVPGVVRVTSGYAGGTVPHPTYEQVCAETTGHAEVVQVEFDSAKVNLTQLLELFWIVHDPTQVGGQGGDHGSQYRSIILPANTDQTAIAERSRAQAQAGFRAPLTTEIVPLDTFWPAETYHQNYFALHPDRGYCAVVVRPKVDKVKRALSQTEAAR